MASNPLSSQASAVADAIRAGDIDLAARHMSGLRTAIGSSAPGEDARAAAGIVAEARKLAIIHRSQVMHALQSIVRQQLYRRPPPPRSPSFQMDG